MAQRRIAIPILTPRPAPRQNSDDPSPQTKDSPSARGLFAGLAPRLRDPGVIVAPLQGVSEGGVPAGGGWRGCVDSGLGASECLGVLFWLAEGSHSRARIGRPPAFLGGLLTSVAEGHYSRVALARRPAA